MEFGFFAYAFITLFLIIDPIANVPLFGSILARKNERSRKRMVRQALVIGCAVLLILTLVGKRFFDFMGVEIYSFRVAGGILLFIISIEMLFGGHTRTEHTDEEHVAARRMDDVVVTPMAIPLLTGPGAITTAIVLFESASLGQKPLVLAAIVGAFAVSWIILELGNEMFKRLGPISVKVIIRVMGLVLAAIAVQFVFAGISEGWKALMAA